jgi:hypothetical protein
MTNQFRGGRVDRRTTPDFDAIARLIANKLGTFSDGAVNHRLATIAGPVICERDRQSLRDAIKAADR